MNKRQQMDKMNGKVMKALKRKENDMRGRGMGRRGFKMETDERDREEKECPISHQHQ